ncbi:RagB/SusD family nutrient uptake outer membrane protein [Fodinibius salsisoli]|uniref:RagB/SusD family nutrient uptake outer membrane protein n=1 Tax=Fodinibius salsisoli TaxID=2820877 RepID=A0ABT3PL05_9BACT|nr:RagB/SusD family nutrient uptake outer membrane protein [Fodinibius salsisoli]MCW9706626.1 RagB/SusD family nutrient uptake outer membrane protein [Fodinibius salsisoli]
MSTLKTIIVLIFASFVVIGCQPDLLETIPNDRISADIFWQTEADAELAANALYPTLDGLRTVTYDGITDILHTNRAFMGNYTIERGRATADHGRFLGEWDDAYEAIRRANDFMDNIDRVESDNADVINRLKGEVMTIRAYHYIKLAMLYGDVPLITKGIDIEEGRNVTRTPVDEVWNFIASELDKAASLLPVDNGSRISQGVANGLKARAMLFAGRYAEAAVAAKDVMDSGQYDLHSSYFELFQYEGEGNNEVILQREYAKGTDNHNPYTVLAPWSQIGGSNGSQYVPTAKLVDLYKMKNGMAINEEGSGYDTSNPYENRDPRLKYSIFVDGVPLPGGGVYNSTPGGDGSDPVGETIYATTTGFNVRKYVDEEDYTDPGNSGLNINLLRYAEVLLTYAEAKIELNEIDQSVYDAINAVRQRDDVSMPPITSADASSQTEMRAVVRKERTIELAFEGLRLFDIRRWKIAEDVMQGDPRGTYYVENDEVKQVEVAGIDRLFDPAKDYLWPIPERERELTSLSQNPGW